MKPELKPYKGWQYRVIVCNENGIYVFDDVHHRAQVVETARILVSFLPVEKDHD